MKDTQKSAKSTTAVGKTFEAFTDEERAAMKEHVQEQKASARRGPRIDHVTLPQSAARPVQCLPRARAATTTTREVGVIWSWLLKPARRVGQRPVRSATGLDLLPGRLGDTGASTHSPGQAGPVIPTGAIV